MGIPHCLIVAIAKVQYRKNLPISNKKAFKTIILKCSVFLTNNSKMLSLQIKINEFTSVILTCSSKIASDSSSSVMRAFFLSLAVWAATRFFNFLWKTNRATHVNSAPHSRQPSRSKKINKRNSWIVLRNFIQTCEGLVLQELDCLIVSVFADSQARLVDLGELLDWWVPFFVILLLMEEYFSIAIFHAELLYYTEYKGLVICYLRFSHKRAWFDTGIASAATKYG